jgi:hypothetical protein
MVFIQGFLNARVHSAMAEENQGFVGTCMLKIAQHDPELAKMIAPDYFSAGRQQNQHQCRPNSCVPGGSPHSGPR